MHGYRESYSSVPETVDIPFPVGKVHSYSVLMCSARYCHCARCVSEDNAVCGFIGTLKNPCPDFSYIH